MQGQLPQPQPFARGNRAFPTAVPKPIAKTQIKTVDQAKGLESYLRQLKKAKTSETTIRNYRSDIGQFLQFYQAESGLADNGQSADQLTDELTKQRFVEKFASDQKKKGLAEATIRRKLVSINQYLAWVAKTAVPQPTGQLPQGQSTPLPSFQKNTTTLLDIGIEKILNQYLTTLKYNSASDATVRNYRSDIKQFAYFIREKTLAKLLTLNNLKQFALGQKQKGLKASSVQRKLVSITQFAVWAQRKQLISGVTPDWAITALDSVFTPSTTDGPILITSPAEEKGIRLGKRRFGRETWLAGLVLLLLLFGSGVGLYLVRTVQELRRQASVDVTQEPTTQSTDSTDYSILLALIEGQHIIPFRGKLYRAESGEQITGAATASFRLVDGPSEEAEIVWESGFCQVSTNVDGTFDLTLGGGTGEGSDGADCGAPLSSDVYYGNSNLWLSTIIGGEALALYPIKTVSYSEDSALLAGAPLGNPVVNHSVLYMNEQGEVLFADEPTFNVPEGNLTLAGENIYFITEGRGGVFSDSTLVAPSAILGGADQSPLTLFAGEDSTEPLLALGEAGAYINTSGNELQFFDQSTGVVYSLAELAADQAGESFWSQSGTAISYAAGNVGVGTSTTEQALTVGGNIQLGTTDADRYVYFDNGTSTNSGIRYNSSTDKLQFSHDGSTWSDFGSGSGAVSSVANSDGTLTISPTTGAVVASLNLGNANTWTATQTFGSLTATGTLTANGAFDSNGDVTIADTNVVFDGVTTTFTTTGDLTIDSGGGQVYLADTDTLNIGGLTNVAYNALANATDAPEEVAISTDNDLYVGGDVEIDGTLYAANIIATALAWDDLTAPTADLTLAMGIYNTTFNWVPVADTDETNFSLTTQGTDAALGGEVDQVLLALSQTSNGVDTDQAADALLTLANNDLDDPVTSAIRFDAGAGGTDFTYGINFDAASIGTAELLLQNGESINNVTDGIIGVTATALQLNPYGVSSGNTGDLRLMELTANGTEYTGFKSPDSLAATLLYELPNTAGLGDYVLTWQAGNVLQWKNVTGVGGAGDITAVGSMISGDTFADANADDDWLGLGAGAGRIEFDDQTIDEVNILDANVGIGTSTPAGKLHVAGTTAIFGEGEGGTPTATTIRGAAAAGTDIAGADLTFDASNGTGTGGSGDLIFRTADISGVQLDTTNSTVGLTTPVTLSSFTVASNSNRLLMCGTAVRGAPTVSSITWNGGAEPFTKIDDNQPGVDVRVELWYLLNPTATTANIVATMSGNQSVILGCVSLYNVNQTTPLGTSSESNGTGTTASVNVTSAIGDYIVDIVGDQATGGNLTAGSGQTERWNQSPLDHDGAMSTELAGTTTTTMSWSISVSDVWAIIGVAVKPSTFLSGTTSNLLQERMRIDSAGNVGIGTSTPGARLDVNGDLIVQGGDITGANGAAIDLGEATSGDVTITGDLLVDYHASFGNDTTTIDTNNAFEIDHIFTTADGSEAGLYNETTYNFTAAGNMIINGIRGIIVADDVIEGANDVDLRGLSIAVQNQVGSTLNEVWGGYFLIDQNDTSAGVIDVAYGVESIIDTAAGSTITTAYGLRTDLINAGTIGTYYGLYLNDVIEGTQTNAYGIWGNEGDWILDEDGGGTAGGTTGGGDLMLGEDQDLELYHDGTNSYIMNNTGDLYIGDAGTDDVILSVNGGRVGIGTAVPSSILDLGFSNATDPTSGGGNGLFFSNTDTTANTISTILFRANDTTGVLRHSGAIVMGKESDWSGTDYPGYLSFWTRPVGGNEVERMRITSNGNVGIGTTGPGSTLEVKGSTNLYPTSNFITAGTARQLTIGEASNNSAYRLAMGYYLDSGATWTGVVQATANSAGTRLLLNPIGGNVGIGTTAPSQLLTVNGVGMFGTADASEVLLGMTVNTAGHEGVSLYHTGTEAFLSSVDAGTAWHDLTLQAANIRFDMNGSTDDVIITSGGDVQIGTTNNDPAASNVAGILLRGDGFLSMNRASAIAARFGVGVDGAIVQFYSAGTNEGSISVSGATISYNAFTGSHFGKLSGSAQRGELVSLTGTNTYSHGNTNAEIIYGITKTVQENDPKVLGSYLSILEPTQARSNENPDLIMSVGNGDMWVADTGENITRGDYLISSSVSGHARKDPETYEKSYIVARAAEDVNWSGVTEAIDGVKHKKISVLFESFTALRDQDLTLSDAGYLNIEETTPGNFQVADTSGRNLVDELGAFTQLIAGNIQTGVVDTQELVANNITVAGQSLQDFVQNIVDQTIANLPEGSFGGNAELVSPVPGEDLTIKLDETPEGDASVLQVTNASDEAVLTVDNRGNVSALGKLTVSEIESTGQSKLGELIVTGDATVSGTLTANNIDATSSRLDYLEGQIAQFSEVKAQTLEVTEATVSGTLYADSINDFDGMIASAFTQPSLINTIFGNTQQVDPFDGFDLNTANAQDLNLAIEDLELEVDDVVIAPSAVFINDYFKVNGSGYVAGSLGVGQNLVIGDGIQIGNGAIAFRPSVVDENTVFYIQPERIGTLSLFGSLMTLAADGRVTINGDLRVAGAVDIAGEARVETSLLTNLIKPLNPNGPIQIQLGEEASQSGQVNNSRFEIIDELGTPVATISAAGAANFSGGVGVDSGTNGTGTVETSPGNFLTTKTAGKAYVAAGLTEVTIKSDKITDNTLIYVTLLGTTNNQVLYVKQQVPENPTTLTKEGRFVVGLDFALTQDVTFNWWTVQ